jgi:microcin C transport system ATP-binding protein
MTTPILSIKNLDVSFATPGGPFAAVKNVSFDIHRGECVAVVGESGSGKSVTALSVLQLLSPSARYGAGSSITFNGTEMVGANTATLQSIRGAKIGMIFQEPLTSLNPLHTIERQITESIRIHQPHLNAAQTRVRLMELLDQVELETLAHRLNAYPHELSGGQRQRVMIAIALANTPDLLIADEPTTALDVTIQAEILSLIHTLKTRHNMAIMMITHDLTIVEKMSDRVIVMQNGSVVEQAVTTTLFTAPQHPYTKNLLNAHPKGDVAPAPTGTKTVLTADHMHVRFPRAKNWFGKPTSFVHAVNDVSVSLNAGHTLGVVGESGSGKTTLALALLRLTPADGPVVFMGTRIDKLSRAALRPLRAKLQIVFQDPFGSLSPRMTVGDIVGEGLAVHAPHLSRAERDEKIITALHRVGLDPATRHRYPHEFSGGQRQRISIARAVVLEPAVVVLDEPTSALDVQVQAQIVDLLRTLQRDLGLAYIFITHDLRVMRALAHHVMVMKDGCVVEQGPATDVFTSPTHPYTKRLLNAALNLKAG